MSTSSSITLLQTIEWAKKFNFLRRSAIGNFMEPAITSANIVMQTMLGAPFSWRWNRVVTGFVTTAGQQDYFLYGAWPASTLVGLGQLLVDSNGNSQVVSVAGTTGSTIPSFNNSPAGTTVDGTATWENLGPIGQLTSPSYSFAWFETVSVQDASKGWLEIESKLSLGKGSEPGRPRFISAQSDDGQGNITFRLLPVPLVAQPLAITLQQKPTLFTEISQTWSPIPNEYSHIYNWGFLALMELFADDPRWQLANQKFVTQLLSSSEGLTETEKNIFLGNWSYVTGEPVSNQSRMNQGDQARGT